MKKLAYCLTYLLCFGLAVEASSVIRQINIEQLTADAPRIFLGKCLSARSGYDNHKLPATFYTFQVAKIYKGTLPPEITIKQFGGGPVSPESSVLRIDGMPDYKPGESYLLFLGEESELGFSSPQGLSQGAFRTYRDPATHRLAVENGVQNQGLFKGLKRSAEGPRTRAIHQSDSADGPVFLDDLTICIAQLLKK